LQALAHALEQGKGAIVLVPEISLTPQTVERFKARFSSGKLQTLVAVLHSHLSAGERHDEWHKIRQGRARIVIGARSAVFAPVEPLGLIIVDEEHEHTYKQEEAPRYNARDVAIVRGQMEGAVVMAMSNVLLSEVTFAQGQVTQGNYHDYKVARMSAAPRAVDVHLVESEGLPGGIGEPGVPPACGALGNAIFAATGVRVRELPVGTQLAGWQARRGTGVR